jgi:hypothetical protein
MPSSKAVIEPPNYKPRPLRSGFVSVVGLIILLSIVLLEVGCRLLPVQLDLSSIESQDGGSSHMEVTREVDDRTGFPGPYALRRQQSSAVESPEQSSSSPQTTSFDFQIVQASSTWNTPSAPTAAPSFGQGVAGPVTIGASLPITTKGTKTTKKSPGGEEDFTFSVFRTPGGGYFSQVGQTIIATKTVTPGSGPILTIDIETFTTRVSTSPTILGSAGILGVPTQELDAGSRVQSQSQVTTLGNVRVPDPATTPIFGARPVAVDGEAFTEPRVTALGATSLSPESGVQVIKVAEVYVATPRVLTNSYGVPTATVQDVPSGFSLTALGTYTVTLGTYDITVRPVVTYLTDEKGVTTATSTEIRTLRPQTTATGTGAPETGLPGAFVSVQFYTLTKGDYFVGFFLPTMMAVILAILVRIISLTAMMYQPLNALTRPQTATASESLCLRTGLFHGIYSSFHGLRHSSPVPFLSALLALCATTLTPLASEAVGLKLRGSCKKGNVKGCAMQLAVAEMPTRITMGILSFMLAVLVAMLVILYRWRSGVACNPWSLASVLAVSRDARLQRSLCVEPDAKGQITRRQLARAFDGMTFKMGFTPEPGGGASYGIAVVDSRSGGDDGDGDGDGRPRLRGRSGTVMTLGATMVHVDSDKRRRIVSSVLFLLLDIGLLIIIFYYNSTDGDSGFERFMEHQTFGVRFLFAALGVIVTLFWSSFFRSR